MKWLVVVLVVALSGCTVTTRVSGRWSEPEPSQDVALIEQHKQLTTVVRNMTGELTAAPNEIEAVNAILRKYGIARSDETK